MVTKAIISGSVIAKKTPPLERTPKGGEGEERRVSKLLCAYLEKL